MKGTAAQLLLQHFHKQKLMFHNLKMAPEVLLHYAANREENQGYAPDMRPVCFYFFETQFRYSRKEIRNLKTKRILWQEQRAQLAVGHEDTVHEDKIIHCWVWHTRRSRVSSKKRADISSLMHSSCQEIVLIQSLTQTHVNPWNLF